MNSKLISIALFLIVFVGTASAGTYAVSSDGSGAEIFSLSEAKAYADSHLNEQITFQLQTGNYGPVYFSGSVSRTGWDKNVTFKPAPGESPVFERLKIGSDGTSVNRFIVFENIIVKEASPGNWGVKIVYSSNAKLINCNISGVSGESNYGITIEGNGPLNDIVIDGCKIKETGKGMHLWGDIREGVIIQNNELYNLSFDALWIDIGGWRNNGEIIFENNRIWGAKPFGTNPHYSGIAIRKATDNVTIRNNILRDTGNTGAITFYVDGVTGEYGSFDNMVIEKNLIYDNKNPTNTALFYSLGKNVVIRDNTIISAYTDKIARQHYLPTNYVFQSAVAMTLGSAPGLDGSDISFYNNIIIGSANINPVIWANCNRGNNLYWSVDVGGTWLIAQPDTSDIVTLDPINNVNYFEGSGNFFVGGADFDVYSYTRADDGSSDGTSHGVNLNDAYYPVMTSAACLEGIVTKGHLVGEACAGAGQECVDIQSLMDYIQQWKEGSLEITALIEKIVLWKTGC